MRKLFMVIASVLLCIGLFAGCNMLDPNGDLGGSSGTEGETPADRIPLEIVIEKYNKLSDAQEIEQKIDISQGELVQFESEKTYTLTGDEYRLTGKEKRLNSLASEKEGPYTETTVDKTVKKGTFSIKLDLNELYFSTAPVFENGILEIGISDNSVEAVFGISEDLPAPVHGMTLKITTDEEHVTGIDMTYGSGSSTVNITLKFKY